MIIGVACDYYKLTFFEREFTARGFSFVVKPGITQDTRIIQVTCESELFEKTKDKVGQACRKLEYSKPWKN